jgi:hypothetical protein
MKLLHSVLDISRLHPSYRLDRGAWYALPFDVEIVTVAWVAALISILLTPIKRLSWKRSPGDLILPRAPPSRRRAIIISDFQSFALRANHLDDESKFESALTNPDAMTTKTQI